MSEKPAKAPRFTRPHRYVWWMSVFLIITGSVIAILGVPSAQLQDFFNANRGLNGLIVLVLSLGIGTAFWQVLILWPEIRWLNRFAAGDGNTDSSGLRLLSPLAGPLLAGRESAESGWRSGLEAVASRIDESRDILRYMVGVLVFLGLLGTFWGLLQTVSAIGDLIGSLDPSQEESATLLADLIGGLRGPLDGMGTAFSSSLFGLGGSLILGFLDLQAGHAQTRFYNELEDWLTRLAGSREGSAAPGMAALTGAVTDLTAALGRGAAAERQATRAPGNPFRQEE